MLLLYRRGAAVLFVESSSEIRIRTVEITDSTANLSLEIYSKSLSGLEPDPQGTRDLNGPYPLPLFIGGIVSGPESHPCVSNYGGKRRT